VLTVVVLTVLYMIGFQVPASLYDRPIIGVVDPDSPAAVAGLRPGDEILSIDGEAQENWEKARYNVLVRPEAALQLEISRDGAAREVTVRSQSTQVDKVGTIGVHPLIRIGEVLEGAPAEEAGLKPDDAIIRIGDEPIRSFADIIPIVAGSAGKPLQLQVYRDGHIFGMEVTPRDDGPGLRVGIAPKMVVRQFGLLAAVKEAFIWSWSMTRQTFDILSRLVTAQISPKTMMGPLGIAKASGDAARGGLGPLFYLMAVISLQLGILNLLPLPPLDGGHLAILAGESIIRRDFSLAVKMWIVNAGAMLLMLLIGLIVYSDLSKTSLLGKYLP
jgi:regulator of sigma E protease